MWPSTSLIIDSWCFPPAFSFEHKQLLLARRITRWINLLMLRRLQLRLPPQGPNRPTPRYDCVSLARITKGSHLWLNFTFLQVILLSIPTSFGRMMESPLLSTALDTSVTSWMCSSTRASSSLFRIYYLVTDSRLCKLSMTSPVVPHMSLSYIPILFSPGGTLTL